MKEYIISFINDSVREQSIEFKSDSVLSDLIDSITFIKIVVALEEKFDFEFEDEMLSFSKLQKIEDLVDYVQSCLK